MLPVFNLNFYEENANQVTDLQQHGDDVIFLRKQGGY